MDINVGNDIRINFRLRNIDNDDSDVKDIKCYLINTSVEKDDYSNHCIHRFPKEPFPQYNPTTHTIRNCGKPVYNVLPHCGCCMEYNKTEIKQDIVLHTYENNYIYEAYCIDNENDTYSAYFPGHDQQILGKYKMVVLVTMSHTDWGKENVHEYCIDYGDSFTLVKTGGYQGYVIDYTNLTTYSIELEENNALVLKGNSYSKPFKIKCVSLENTTYLTYAQCQELGINVEGEYVDFDDMRVYCNSVSNDITVTLSLKLNGQLLDTKLVSIEYKEITNTKRDISITDVDFGNVEYNVTNLTANIPYIETITYTKGLPDVLNKVHVENISILQNDSITSKTTTGSFDLYGKTINWTVVQNGKPVVYIGYVEDPTDTESYNNLDEYDINTDQYVTQCPTNGYYLAFVLPEHKDYKLKLPGNFIVPILYVDNVDGFYCYYLNEPLSTKFPLTFTIL